MGRLNNVGGFWKGKGKERRGEGLFERLYSLVAGIRVFGALLLLLEDLSRLVLVYFGHWDGGLRLLAVLELLVGVNDRLQLLLI